MERDNIEKIKILMKNGINFLGTEYAILGGAMTWISDAHLVSCMSNAGIFGILASGAMNGVLLKNEIILTKKKTAKNFGVNIILANPNLHDLIDICAEEKVSHIILAGGIPDKSLIEKIHSYNIKVIGFAPNLAFAKRLFKNDIDALILEGSEAGGHVGAISTIVLVQDILLNMPGHTIFIAGGILRGEIIASMLQLGASGCQLGTVFACAKESLAHKSFKKAFFRASGRDAIVPIQLDKNFPITPVRALSNAATEQFLKKQKEIILKYYGNQLTLAEGRLQLEHFWSGALKRAVKEGDTECGSLMAGQIVEIIRQECSIQEIIYKITQEMSYFLDKYQI